MTAHIIVSFTPNDAAKLKQYSEAAGATVKAHSGVFLARGAFELLAGESDHTVHAVIEFPSREAAQAWYNSDEYQALITLRNEGMAAAVFALVG
jgi:uncharacterized protein (DUF1330 family)